ncbi:hypothetical protein OEZ85_007976 [Tetradesmus obliquus]|uniref:GPI ethanolamine phosphate transferase 3 n=1 Tax=Tetradesmus obliquus TaxID=3088 RepID=A0ABY8THI8_TETOB|nr:hypothetical protein OEZ85_007976 [Tetradesmus obliquus]
MTTFEGAHPLEIEADFTCPAILWCSRPAYSKAVVLIVDALRYDFVCDDGSSKASFRGRFPKTLGFVGAAGDGAVVARFVADTPTITMSRLKALLTGGLPTFLDVGQSFSASALSEDNLLQQLQAQGKRMVFMGDDTWMQLAKDAFVEAHPYPSFDVHDLLTVDDGVWEHLLPLLASPSSWDVLIGHYLGVDHAGHSHGVASRQMEAKLGQMDDQVSQVLESLVAQAGPDGPYADTLLLVLSDHGQTLGGDHGGGTPDETDSVLLAVSLRKMHQALQQQQQQQAQQARVAAAGTAAEPASPLTLSSKPQHYCEHCTPGSGQPDSSCPTLRRLMHTGGYLPSNDDAQTLDFDSSSSSSSSNGTGAIASCLQQCWPWLCSSSMSQIDLTPTVAHLLGVPIPFGNLGKLPPHLFAALAVDSSTGGAGPAAGSSAEAWLAQYAAALHANAEQVHAYLNRYAAVGGLPSADLSSVNTLYQHAQQLWQANQQAAAATPATPAAAASKAAQPADPAAAGSQANAERGVADDATEQLIGAQMAFLNAGVDLARGRFTLFQQGPIWAGCAMGVVVLVLQLAYCWQAVRSLSSGGQDSTERSTILLFAALAAFHALGLFSVGLLMGEGRLQCVLLAAATLLLLRAVLAAVLRARSARATADAATKLACAAGCDASGSIAAVKQQVSVQRSEADAAPDTGASDTHCYSWQHIATAVAAAAVMLACNVLLQAMGLIDRAGQDPHDKTQPSGDFAAVQQQHILLWAIFAPKLCFELWFMAVTDVGQLLVSALAGAVL